MNFLQLLFSAISSFGNPDQSVCLYDQNTSNLLVYRPPPSFIIQEAEIIRGQWIGISWMGRQSVRSQVSLFSEIPIL